MGKSVLAQTVSSPTASALPCPTPVKPTPRPVRVETRVYSTEFLLGFAAVPAKEELKEIFLPKHPCHRIYNGCKYGDKCHFSQLRIDTCWWCLHGETHETCEGPKPPTHPCMRVWGACRYGDACRYRSIPRVWCLLCLRGSEHTTCSGVKPKNIPTDLSNYVHGPGRVEVDERRPTTPKQSPQVPVRGIFIEIARSRSPSPTPPAVVTECASSPASTFVSPFKKMMQNPESIALKAITSALNKITPEKFDSQLSQIEDAVAPFLDQTPEVGKPTLLQGACKLIFEKALAEGHMTHLYARLCSELRKRLLKYNEDGAKLFRRFVIESCQEQFQALAPVDDLDALSKFRDRCNGNINFLGQLYLQNLVAGKVIDGVIDKLLLPTDATTFSDHVELLCRLLEIIGATISKASDQTRLFAKLNALQASPMLEPRVQFAVLSILELRSNNWAARHQKIVPQTLAELENLWGADTRHPPRAG